MLREPTIVSTITTGAKPWTPPMTPTIRGILSHLRNWVTTSPSTVAQVAPAFPMLLHWVHLYPVRVRGAILARCAVCEVAGCCPNDFPPYNWLELKTYSGPGWAGLNPAFNDSTAAGCSGMLRTQVWTRVWTRVWTECRRECEHGRAGGSLTQTRKGMWARRTWKGI